jgi:hypothetical protein
MSQEAIEIIAPNTNVVTLVEKNVEVIEVNNDRVEVIEVIETNHDVVEVVEKEIEVVEIIERGPQGVKGDKGDTGENAPLLWIDLVSMWDTPPVLVSGTVWSYTWEGITRYRNVPSPYNPADDAFYSDLGLTNLIVARA